MNGGEATLAWVLFWVFALISTISTFFIIRHFRSTRLAILIASLDVVFFVALYFFLRYLMQPLGS